MFSTDHADRTLPPTERRRREARSRGDTILSPILTSSLVLILAASILWWSASALTAEIASLIRRALATKPAITISPTASTMTASILQTTEGIVTTTLIGLTLIFFGAILASFGQKGWIWIPSSAIPRFRLQSLISGERTAESAGAMLRLVLLVVISGVFVKTHFHNIFLIEQTEPAAMFLRGAELVGLLLLQLSICLFMIGILDYLFRFWCFQQRLKMTIQERRREQKEDEVNPGIRKKRAANQSVAAPEVKVLESIRSIDH